MTIKIVILDLDLTLVNSIYRFYSVFNKTLRKLYNIDVDWDTFLEYFKADELNKLLPNNANVEIFWKEFRRGYINEPIHEKDKLYPKTEEVLKWLKSKGLKVIVTTGREIPPQLVWDELKYFGIDKYVDDVFTIIHQDPDDEDILFLKTGIIKCILDKYKVKPNEAIFVGDYWVDMESCKRLNVIAIGVLTGYESEEKLKRYGARYVIESIADLPSILSKVFNL